MMQIESRKKTRRKQKVVRKKKLGWMWKWHDYDEEMIRNDSRKEAEGSERKQKRDRNEG